MRRALFLVLLVALAPPALAARWSVLADVTVNADRYTLADLVPGGPEEFSRVTLGASPRPGQSAQVSGQWLQSRLPEAERFDLPDTVRVSRPGRELTRAEVEEAVVSALRERLGADAAFSVEEVGLPGLLPLGETRLDVRLAPGRPSKNATIWAEVRVDGIQRGRTWARLGSGEARRDAQARAEGGVAKGDLVRLIARRGSIIVTTSAKALAAAGIGQTVAVENVSSKKTVLGVVSDAGVVETGMVAREVN